ENTRATCSKTGTISSTCCAFTTQNTGKPLLLVGSLGQRNHDWLPRYGATRITATSWLTIPGDFPILVVQQSAVQQTLDQLDLGAHRVVAPDFLLHRCWRATAM